VNLEASLKETKTQVRAVAPWNKKKEKRDGDGSLETQVTMSKTIRGHIWKDLYISRVENLKLHLFWIVPEAKRSINNRTLYPTASTPLLHQSTKYKDTCGLFPLHTVLGTVSNAIFLFVVRRLVFK
jgi:hypothetical protein